MKNLNLKKLEIISFYGVFVSVVVLFWALFFKVFCPKILICGVVFVTVVAVIVSALLITKCLTDMEKEGELIIESIENNTHNL